MLVQKKTEYTVAPNTAVV